MDKTIVVGSLFAPPYDKVFESGRRVYSTKGIAPTIHTCAGGNIQPKMLIEYDTQGTTLS